MKKISYSVLALLYRNIMFIAKEDKIPAKQVVKRILTNKQELQWYINDLHYDCQLMEDDETNIIKTHYNLCKKSIEELNQLL